MKQREISKWLKGITFIVGIMGVLFFALIAPKFLLGLTHNWLVVAYLSPIAVGCYAVLFLFWGVCTEIGRDNSFSEETAKAFVIISRITLAMAIYWFIGLVVFAFGTWINSGIVIFLIIAVIVSIAVSILSAALSHLILKAYELKQQSDLTI